MKDLPSLISQGVKDARRQEDAIVRQTAKAYKDAYQNAESEMALLFINSNPEDVKLNAAKYNRLNNTLDSISKDYQKLTGKTLNATTKQGAKNYMNASQRIAWGVDQTSGLALSWGVVPVDAIRSSVFSEQSGRNVIVTMKDNSRQRIQSIRSTITRMIATGMSWDRAAEELQSQFNRGYSDAVRVIRTETARNYTEGTLNGISRAEDLGINLDRVWVATLDAETRDTHQALDGKVADEDGLFWIGSDSAPGPGLFAEPENSINCRCAVVAQIRGYSPAFRSDNETKETIPYTTYSDWAQSRGMSENGDWQKAKDALQ
jgi:SPP1 gp7 family putative phage head morphogenesis protein